MMILEKGVIGETYLIGADGESSNKYKVCWAWQADAVSAYPAASAESNETPRACYAVLE